MALIDSLKFPEDLKKLSNKELEQVACEVRQKIIEVTSRVGGHLASNLGAVELSVALHSVLESPRDKIIWDVGHQSYAHKILTGRLKEFDTIRQLGGLSGFPNRDESPHDVFTVGHASTSISQALGIVRARDSLGEKFSVVSVIGDGSLSGGLALEGLNNVLNLKTNLIVILNDNEMSISEPVGAISNYLTTVRTSGIYSGFKGRVESVINKIPKIGEPLVKSAERLKNRIKHFLVDFKFGVIFEELGFKYLGPIDGHNIPLLMSTLQFAKDVKGPVLVHIITKKGKGYEAAEKSPTKYHGAAPFDRQNGQQQGKSGTTFTSVFANAILEIGKKNDRVITVTAAMTDGTGLGKFASRFPERFYDVGIAEEHAVSFSSGLASQGFRPVAAIYSTFLQRAYDQIVHDVCLNKLPVVFCIDRAGIVGEDGATHHGVFDISFLRQMPNMVLMAPADGRELRSMLEFAVAHDGPVALRYPKSGIPESEIENKGLELGKGQLVCESEVESPKSKILIVSTGSMVYPSVEAAKMLNDSGIAVSVINARFIKPLDRELILGHCKGKDLVVTVEEGGLAGGFGSSVMELMEESSVKVPVKRIGVPDQFVGHGKRDQLLKELGLDAEGITGFVKKEIGA